MTLVFPGEIDSSVSEAECRALHRLAQDKTVLELGSWLGRTTVCIAQTALALHAVDWHKGDPHAGSAQTLPDYLRNLYRYGLDGKVVTHLGRFEQVVPALQENHFDLVFLDGFHTYQAVTDDITRARRVLKPGGVFAFHDYGVTASTHGGDTFGVTQAVNEHFPDSEPALVESLAIVRT